MSQPLAVSDQSPDGSDQSPVVSRIPVMEVFGPTIQGEGMVIGKKTMFVRTAGCDYQCAWCDSAFTWNGEEKDLLRMVEPSAIIDELISIGQDRFQHVTISGGNPALIGKPMAEFISLCQENGWKVGLETQGSRWQDWFLSIDDLTLSPKGPSSRMTTSWSALTDIIRRLEEGEVNYSLKIVIFDESDLAFAREVFSSFPGTAQYLQVGNDRTNQPGDISRYLLSRLEWLFERVIADPHLNQARVLPQLHSLVWGNKRAK